MAKTKVFENLINAGFHKKGNVYTKVIDDFNYSLVVQKSNYSDGSYINFRLDIGKAVYARRVVNKSKKQFPDLFDLNDVVEMGNANHLIDEQFLKPLVLKVGSNVEKLKEFMKNEPEVTLNNLMKNLLCVEDASDNA